jgi:hypothetical protein
VTTTEVRKMQSSRNEAVGILPPPDDTSCSSATGGGAAIGQRRDGVAAKAFAEMFLRAVAVAIVGEHGAEALMRRRVIRIGRNAAS